MSLALRATVAASIEATQDSVLLDKTFVELDQRAVALKNFSRATYVLTADAVVAVNVTPLAAVNYLLVGGVVGGAKVKIRITTADGATQVIPINDFLTLLSRTTAITAIDLQRSAGVLTEVTVVLGELA